MEIRNTMWYHSPTDMNFEEDSFKKLWETTSINDFLPMFKALIDKESELLYGLFYFMKNDIKPIWNNKEHINGGSISWKINKSDSIKCWKNLLTLYMSNSFSELDNKYNITGISINPKKNCNILKIWFSKDIPDDEINNLILPDECIFKEKFKLYRRFAKCF